MRERPITSDERAEQAMRIASYASVVVAFVLIFAKTYAWLATGSVAILSSLIDSFLDALASIVTFVAGACEMNYNLFPFFGLPKRIF